MGSYGIGPARVLAAAIEQHHDEKGISWPREVAPFDIEVVTLGKPGEPARELADDLYEDLLEAGLNVLYDDREASPGQKFADAELLGCPLRRTVGKRGLEAGELEAQIRRGRRSVRCPSRRRPRRPWTSGAPCRGRDRRPHLPPPGGPGPLGRAAAGDATRRGAPPLDDPQRDRLLSASPSSRSSWWWPCARTTGATAGLRLFAVIAGATTWTAWRRVTGQYSRLGALLDPLIDRLLVLAGAIVAWEFEFLPRWALLVLAAREVFMLLLTQMPCARASTCRVNMLGRWAVWPVMSALALCLVVDTWVTDALLYLGLADDAGRHRDLRQGRPASPGGRTLNLSLRDATILAYPGPERTRLAGERALPGVRLCQR